MSIGSYDIAYSPNQLVRQGQRRHRRENVIQAPSSGQCMC
ncbi:hypothetical protein BIFGAL_04363 [Bifidobacterium gallicum DSM 20093 = LMG 11596]|uniref:Uncharacterized protein n=1 Tax=Bifidobacterium gallicum DSM 20093 = LMG 11596 TaxID=561180 RepID=D1NWV7_9BIFI|nr:hypothetical protein BIFGAL_04363 [Bifidobacterium gallicum DSM 20093 = LMG 11596]